MFNTSKIGILVVAGIATLLISRSNLYADGAQDNLAATVRPIPPAGIKVPDADRAVLQKGLASLATEIEKLRLQPEAHRLLPDVQIYFIAVDMALRHDEFFAAADIVKAKTLLDTGLERARQLSKGESPWLSQPGPTALGYVSTLDGSVQPFGLYIPETWTRTSPRKWRLDTWFHGRGETLSEVNFIASVTKSGGQFVRPDAFVLQPYGRYCNGSRFAGEVDFFEAMAETARRFSIDEDRIVIRGFSLGGASAWHLTANHAWRWAASAPGAGFSETADFLKVFQDEKLQPTDWERKLWNLYDSPTHAENFRNVPLVVYSGEIDKQKQAADVMEKALADVGIQMVHIIGPQTPHKYHPDSIPLINQRIDAAANRGRDPLPRRVSLVTYSLRHNRQAWIQVDGLGKHWDKATVQGELDAVNTVTIVTGNVTALTIEMPTATAPFVPAMRPPIVIIDGQKLAGPMVASDRSWRAAFHREGKRWLPGPQTSKPRVLRKRPGLQGPIDDAFMAPFLMVTPSNSGWNESVDRWVHAEQLRAIKEWRRHFRGEPRVKRDIDVTADDIANHNLILWGDSQSNRVLATIADRLPIRWNQNTIQVGKQSFDGYHHALIAIYPNPANPDRYVVLNSGFTYREYDYLNNARQTPKLPDWAVVDLNTPPNSRWPGAIADAGFFNESWAITPAAATPAR
jgi:dienelactone hydrolase